MTNRQVAQAFAAGHPKGKSLHMFIDGDTIYSYGYHFPIARRLIGPNGPHYVFTTKKYSVNTTKHCSHVRNALSGSNIYFVDDIVSK